MEPVTLHSLNIFLCSTTGEYIWLYLRGVYIWLPDAKPLLVPRYRCMKETVQCFSHVRDHEQ